MTERIVTQRQAGEETIAWGTGKDYRQIGRRRPNLAAGRVWHGD